MRRQVGLVFVILVIIAIAGTTQAGTITLTQTTMPDQFIIPWYQDQSVYFSLDTPSNITPATIDIFHGGLSSAYDDWFVNVIFNGTNIGGFEIGSGWSATQGSQSSTLDISGLLMDGSNSIEFQADAVDIPQDLGGFIVVRQIEYIIGRVDLTYTSVPIPAAVWLLGSGLVGLVGFRNRFSKA